MSGAFDAPLKAPIINVKPEWIDHNGHMNVAYYLMVFDWGVDHMFELLGIGPDFVKRTNRSTFTLQSSIWYRQEVKLDDPLEVRAQLVAHDAKRLHIWLDMYQAKDNYLAAESEQVTVHVDLDTRRSAPFPEDVMNAISKMASSHAMLPKPAASGMGVSLEKRAKT